MTRAVGTKSQEAAGIREAARALLRNPVITAVRAPETLAMVRRHAGPLRSMFHTQLGYHLVVEASFARLVKLPPEATAPTRILYRCNGTPAGAQTSALIALACAALLAPSVGDQILISQLVTQIRSDAAEQGITVSDTVADRRQLVAALSVLIDWGVLSETDGSVTVWADNESDEALLTVCRPLLPHLLVRSVGPAVTRDEILAPESDAPRRRLRRRLTEDPVVLREHLSADELDILSRERSELARLLSDNFGLVLEVRAEGALAYDPADSLSDIEFPGAGSLKQAALLLIGRLTERVDESSAAVFSWSAVDEVLAELATRYQRAWKTEYAESPRRLREDIAELLTSLQLVDTGSEGIRLLGPAFRYRPRPVATSSQMTLDSIDPQRDS